MKTLLFKSLVLCFFISLWSCSDHYEDLLVQEENAEFDTKLRTPGCTFDLTSQVNFLESRFGDCLSFNPPIPANNQLFIPCGETVLIQPFDCERPLPVMEFSGDCEECVDTVIVTTDPDPCEEISGNIDVEYEKVKEYEDCCFIQMTVTNNSTEPIGIFRRGRLLKTLQPGESSWIRWAQGPDHCFSSPASFPTDVEDLFVAPISDPNAECLDVSFPECDEL